MLKSSGIVFLLFGFCITVICPLVSKMAYSTSDRLKTLFPLSLSCNSFIVNFSLFNTFSSIFPLYTNMLGFPHITFLILMLLKFIEEIAKCCNYKITFTNKKTGETWTTDDLKRIDL